MSVLSLHTLLYFKVYTVVFVGSRHYPALKTLEQLEHTYLPRVSSHWFSNTMAETIPKLRLQIQEASMTEIKDFLENIRKRSIKIGEVAMQHVSSAELLWCLVLLILK